MQVITTIKEMQAFSKAIKAEGKSIGFVPTMGALHKGHISLIENSVEQNDATVVSIFVNPTQFGPTEDFNKYPKDHKGDTEKLIPLNVDALFLPDVAEMYPKGFGTFVFVGGIGMILCGRTRPDHFNGVATVVSKLFNIVMPDRAYFGQKDYQQTVIIKKMVRDIGFDIDIVVCQIVREADGLAMSSRNSYLSDEERKAALILNKALEYGKSLMLSGREDKADHVKEKMTAFIKAEPLVAIEYVEIAGPEYLEILKEIKTPVVILLAAKVGTTRLIDNTTVERRATNDEKQ